MKKYFNFVLVGLLYTVPPEFLNQVVVHGIFLGYLNTLFINFLLLSFGYYVNVNVDRIFRRRSAAVYYYLFFGFFGVMFEWFIIGNSPWKNPDASQITMFSYWAGLFLVPRILIDNNKKIKIIKKSLIGFYLVFSVIMLIVGISVPYTSAPYFIVLSWIIGYNFMNVFYFIYFFKIRKSA